MLIPARFLEAHRAHIQTFAASSTNVPRMDERMPIVGRRKDGTEFLAEAVISKIPDGAEMNFAVMLRDITERRQVEEEHAALAEIGRIISSSLDIEQVYEQFAEKVARLITFDRVVIGIVDVERDTFIARYAAGTEIPSW